MVAILEHRRMYYSLARAPLQLTPTYAAAVRLLLVVFDCLGDNRPVVKIRGLLGLVVTYTRHEAVQGSGEDWKKGLVGTSTSRNPMQLF